MRIDSFKKNTLHIVVMIIIATAATAAFAANEQGSPADALMHHIIDQHEWQPIPGLKPIPLHDITIGPVTIPVTKHVVMLWIIGIFVATIFVAAFHRVKVVPSGVASALEPLLFFVRDSIVYPAMGEEMGKEWLSFFLTLFFFILCANLIGLVPLFGTATGNLSVTAALALMIFVLLIGVGVKKNGPAGFFRTMMPEGMPLPFGLAMLVIEVPSLVIRNGVLAIRLFANMIAGHFVIGSLLLLIFIIHPAATVVSVPMALFINLLEVLVAVIQAMVFTMLSAIFIKSAVSHH